MLKTVAANICETARILIVALSAIIAKTLATRCACRTFAPAWTIVIGVVKRNLFMRVRPAVTTFSISDSVIFAGLIAAT